MYTILVVDDTLFNRKLMIEVLENKIHNTRYLQAEDGIEAMEIVNSNEVDLIILDLTMPNKDGYEVIKDLKSNSATADIPVIVNSSVTDMDSIKLTLEMGAIDYFTKPLTPEQMEVIIPLKVNNILKSFEQNRLLKAVNKNINNELKMAGAFQKSLINMYKDKIFPCMDLSVYFKACDILSGDFFELIDTGASIWFIIGDIRGHGAAASMMSFMVRKLFNNTIRQENEPSDVLERMNKDYNEITEDTELAYFSAFVGRITENNFTYANAGNPHPAILSLDANKSIRLDMNGHFIGFIDDAKYSQESIELENGDCILLHTDGLYQGKQTPNVNLNDTLDNIIKNYSENSSVEVLTKMVYNQYIKKDEELQDDITIVALKYKI